MNQRVVVIVLVALFTTCFVGTGAIATLTVLNKAFESTADRTPSRKPPPPSEPDEATEPPATDPLATAEPDPDKTPDEAPSPPAEAEAADDFSAPLQGAAEFAVFHVDKAKVDPWVALQKAAKGTKVKVFKGDAPASAMPPYLELRDLAVTDYAVIAGDTLQAGRGLTAAVKAALPSAKRVSVLDAALPLGGSALLDVSRVMFAYAQLTGGVLWDEESQEYLALDAWKQRRIDSWDKALPHVSMHFTVFVDTRANAVELRTAGMKHFGLPELELKNIPKEMKDAAVALLNATAQVLAEGKRAPGPGPLTVALATIKHVQHRKNLEARATTDAERSVDVVLVPGSSTKVPTLAITFSGEGTPSERVSAGIETLFGFAE